MRPQVARLEKERSVSKRQEFKRALSIVEVSKHLSEATDAAQREESLTMLPCTRMFQGLMEKDADGDLGDIPAEEKVGGLQAEEPPTEYDMLTDGVAGSAVRVDPANLLPF